MDICKYQNIPHVYGCFSIIYFSSSLLSSLIGQWFILHNQVTPFPSYMNCLYPLGHLNRKIRDLESGHMRLISSLSPRALQGCLCSQRSLDNFQFCYSDFCRGSFSASLNPPSTCLEMITTFVSLDPGYLLLNPWHSKDHFSLKKSSLYQTVLKDNS